MEKITLYQKNTTGKTKVWSIWVVANDNETASKWVEHGQLDGKMQLVETIVNSGKNEGKKNATTPYTQAIADANSDAEAKKKKGYVDDLDNAVDSTTLGSGVKSCMLAQKYDPTLKIKGSKNLEKLKLIGKEIGTSAKLDGFRC